MKRCAIWIFIASSLRQVAGQISQANKMDQKELPDGNAIFKKMQQRYERPKEFMKEHLPQVPGQQRIHKPDAYRDENSWEATFTVNLKGNEDATDFDFFTIRVHPSWAPAGAARFKEIIDAGIFKGARFFHCKPGFMVSFGLPGEPEDAEVWEQKTIDDDPVVKSNAPWTLSYAHSGPDTRAIQMFINIVDNKHLDAEGFAPFAEVVAGMPTIAGLNWKYGDEPDAARIFNEGNDFLRYKYPDMSYIVDVQVAKAGTSASKEM